MYMDTFVSLKELGAKMFAFSATNLLPNHDQMNIPTLTELQNALAATPSIATQRAQAVPLAFRVVKTNTRLFIVKDSC